MIKVILKLIYVFTAAFLIFYAVTSIRVTFEANDEKPATQLPVKQDYFKEPQDIKVIKSKLINETDSSWKISAIKTRLKGKSQQYFFLNRERGWAFGENLYTTQDGGKIWELVKVNKPQNTLISQVFFQDENNGWITVQKGKVDFLRANENQFGLFETEDGGKSWSERARVNGVVIDDFTFADAEKGWIIGTKFTAVSPVRFEIYMLVTVDGGINWKDVSISLNKKVVETRESVNQRVSSVTYNGRQIILLSSEHQIFQTDDFGDNWKYLADLPNDNPYTSISIKRMREGEDNSLWFIGGNYHYGSAVGTVTKKVKTNREKYVLGNVYFSDGLFLPNDEVIICGFKTHKNKQPTGIILHSLDGGKVWTTLIDDYKTHNIQNLQVIDKSTVIAWDSNGTIYVLNKNLS